MPSGPTIPRRNDEELALAAQGGCRASFEQLVRRYQVPLTHFLRQRASAHEAEDLVQDTFLRAYENLYRYRPAHRFRTWLFTIARRLNFNRMRKRRPAADSDLLRWLASPVRTAEAVADEESRRKLWQTAAEVLSYRQWTALWLYYVEDMPVKVILNDKTALLGAAYWGTYLQDKT